MRAGHDEDAIRSFLDARRGYCEQFAGTYAAFARSIGLPARVAVGFTPGELTDGVYVVRGQHAHAWPEVWFEGIGWVPFEPTPGRGAPGAQSYTFVEPQQSTEGDSPSSSATTAVPGGASASTSLPSGEDLAGLIPGELGGNVEAVGFSDPGESVWPRRMLIALAAVAVAALLWAVLVPLAARPAAPSAPQGGHHDHGPGARCVGRSRRGLHGGRGATEATGDLPGVRDPGGDSDARTARDDASTGRRRLGRPVLRRSAARRGRRAGGAHGG